MSIARHPWLRSGVQQYETVAGHRSAWAPHDSGGLDKLYLSGGPKPREADFFGMEYLEEVIPDSGVLRSIEAGTNSGSSDKYEDSLVSERILSVLDSTRSKKPMQKAHALVQLGIRAGDSHGFGVLLWEFKRAAGMNASTPGQCSGSWLIRPQIPANVSSQLLVSQNSVPACKTLAGLNGLLD
ncbi:hypothetical protein BDZ97DRAFT_1765056 [Flammula alnicola]|nr:hypothetical protein BDZ97DRAFT_1765056 [Flammula alnicola]